MHRASLISVVLAAGLATSIALAAPNKVETEFQALGASTVTGKATIDAMNTGGSIVHAAIRGLTPGVEYISLVYQQDGSCASGGITTELARFTANPAGVANFNEKVALELSAFRSISIQRVSDNSVQACAPVTP